VLAHHRRDRAPRASRIVGALALLAPLALTSHAAAAADSSGGSPLSLWAPPKVVAYAYDGQVYTDFGLQLVAAQDPVEVWSTRASYSEPIVSEWRSPQGTRTLPPSLAMPDFSGLAGFADITVRRVRDGKRAARLELDTCLNGYAQRARPDAPAHSPYPTGCPWNPYTLGSVMGIQAGYATPLTQDWESDLSLKPGRYDVAASIDPAYAAFFGIDDADASRTTRLVVKRESEAEYRRAQQPGTQDPVAQPAAQEPAGESGGDTSGPTPDLRSLPAFGVGLNRKGTVLRFGATVWNAGTSPLVVDGFRAEGEDRMDAYQYFFDTDGNQTGYAKVGDMHWHAQNHQHWHFEDFAQYRLLDADLQEAVVSEKQSFCLANTDAVDYTVPGADWDPENTDLATACGGRDALSVREVLASGSGDTYLQFRYGQAFPIKRVPDGVYYIAVEANPAHEGARHLVESDYGNNDSLRKIRISTDRHGHRKVMAYAVGNVVEGDTVGEM